MFLAFNSVEFGNKYFRSIPLDTPLITLGGYLHFWSVIYMVVTAWLLKYQKEVSRSPRRRLLAPVRPHR